MHSARFACSIGFATYFTQAAAYAVLGINNPGLDDERGWIALVFFLTLQGQAGLRDILIHASCGVDEPIIWDLITSPDL